MNQFICQECGGDSYSAARLENLKYPYCQYCGAELIKKTAPNGNSEAAKGKHN